MILSATLFEHRIMWDKASTCLVETTASFVYKHLGTQALDLLSRQNNLHPLALSTLNHGLQQLQISQRLRRTLQAILPAGLYPLGPRLHLGLHSTSAARKHPRCHVTVLLLSRANTNRVSAHHHAAIVASDGVLIPAQRCTEADLHSPRYAVGSLPDRVNSVNGWQVRLEERSVCREGLGAVVGTEEEACGGREVHTTIKKEAALVGRDFAPLGFYEES